MYKCASIFYDSSSPSKWPTNVSRLYDFKSNTSLEPISSDGELLLALACAGMPYKPQGNDDDGSSDEDSNSNMSELLHLDLLLRLKKNTESANRAKSKEKKMMSCHTVLRCPFAIWMLRKN